MKKLSILGSTGSIGTNSLDVVRRNRDRFDVVALAAGRNLNLLKEQIAEFDPEVVSVIDDEHARRLREMAGPIRADILSGTEGYCQCASVTGADMVLSALVGAAGLLPTIAAIEAGKDIALANKETLVTAGSLVMERVRAKGVRLLPVDSEHSAVFQCLEGQQHGAVRRIVLTASGGPFLHHSREQMAAVTPAEALKHPNWTMGRKITIDSASMMNKGLEVIEARWLFDVDYDRIDVVIHPRSIVHSMVEFRDGSILAQLGVPDMRIPIAYALTWPERIPQPGSLLDLTRAGVIEFLDPDRERFPSLELAYAAGRTGGTAPAVLNGANEVAVEAFLNGRIRFTDMAATIKEVLSSHTKEDIRTVEDVLRADRWAREEAQTIIERQGA
ncbi:MAG: 1-deoxy-D-xylulose-5-phosphate reductoisomerase [Deltaproteobacteria bacterium HGW-Deltaproteobacteria-19]|jgi:1-deoxy-D-xylulose-5-phosphate reductoisomerase|nr:MAG: 1-deoxy-D-xylulose-5-phosphate reductoisomerase [Deltaproteobacteria bacterium HGW-Deltaproteobacteria-19]